MQSASTVEGQYPKQVQESASSIEGSGSTSTLMESASTVEGQYPRQVQESASSIEGQYPQSQH